MAVLWLDLETYSSIPIAHGAHRYAEEAEVLLVALADDQDPVGVWDCTLPENTDWRTRLQQRIDAAERVVIHNSPFDRTVLRHRGIHIPVEKIEDTMVLALQHALPASLGMLCDVLNVEQDKAKDKAGKKLIQLFTKPRPKNMKLRRATRETHPDEWEAFIEYARLDVDAMRDVYRRLPRWNDSDSERNLWRLDQRINDRGVSVDLDLARSALRAFQRTSGTLAARIAELTDGAIGSATQRQKLLDYLRDDCAQAADDLTKSTVGNLLRGELDERTRELLNIRQQAAATSPAKYKVLLQSTSSDGRLRGTIQFCGASRTGRDAGRIFQPQNLPRPSLDASTIDMGIEAMKLDCEDLLFDNVSDLCTSAIRGALVAEPKHKLVVADLSNIEGRVLAWLAGEEWKLKAFRDFDAGTGHDLYVMAYARSFAVEPEEVVHNKKYGDGSMRQIGKLQELALGFQGGAGAFIKMGGTIAERLGEDRIQEIVQAWRRAHPATKSFWYDMEGAAKMAIRDPGASYSARLVTFVVKRDQMGTDWLLMKLPSGRPLSYRNPAIDRGSGQILYEGVNQYTRKWSILETYGGKLVENCVQAVARDVFMSGLKRAEAAGYAVCLRVHDELICETPDEPRFSHEELASLMATNPHWAPMLPLAAAGFETHRYRKD